MTASCQTKHDIIDEAGAAQRISPKSKQKTVGKNEIEEIIAKVARIPLYGLQRRQECSSPYRNAI